MHWKVTPCYFGEKQRACRWDRAWRQIYHCPSQLTALDNSCPLLLLEQSTVRNFEAASKKLLLAESDMSLGYPYMPICAWIFKWWLCGFSPTAMLYKASTIKISLLCTVSVTPLWKKSPFLGSFSLYAWGGQMLWELHCQIYVTKLKILWHQLTPCLSIYPFMNLFHVTYNYSNMQP